MTKSTPSDKFGENQVRIDETDTENASRSLGESCVSPSFDFTGVDLNQTNEVTELENECTVTKPLDGLQVPRSCGTDGELALNCNQGAYPYKYMMHKDSYQEQKFKLQVELLKLQQWVKDNQHRIVVLFEGQDAAGKGGAIKRFLQHLNPRGARLVALATPSDAEKRQWYFQRYVQHLPTAGEIVFFDRSWYNRAGVEKVFNFCDESEYNNFLLHVPEFERSLIRSGLHLIKFWFSVSQNVQKERFERRKNNPLKTWKLSKIDLQSINKWNEYINARDQMFLCSCTTEAPWTVIKSDCKRRSRLNAMRHLLLRFDYDGKNIDQIGNLDSHLVDTGKKLLIHKTDTNPTVSLRS
jgi:polyphosphate kinase 2